jgi:PAS domain S-box-containing protein
MDDNGQTREQLLAELADAQERLARAEAAVARPESDLRLFLDRMPVACVLSDANLVTTYCNQPAELLFGFSAAELVGHHPTSVMVAPEDQRAAAALLEAVVAGTAPAVAIIRTARKDGSSIFCEWRNTRLSNPDGSFSGVLSTAVDITERRAAEEALLRREQEFKSVFDNAPDAISRFDRDLRYVYANAATARLAAIPVDQLIGQEPRRLHSAIGDTTWEAKYRAVFETGEPVTIEFDVDTGFDGAPISRRSFQSSVVPEFAPDGSVQTILSITRDFTELKRANEAAARLAAIVGASDDAISSIGLDGTLTSWNGGSERLFGYTAAEALGRHPSFLLPPDRAGEAAQTIERLLTDTELETIETVRLRKDGQPVHISASYFPLHDSAGRLIGGASISHDITARKAAEDALRESETRFRAIFDTALDAVVGMDAQGRITDWNARAEAIFGWPKAEALGRTLADTIIPEQHREPHRRALARFLVTGDGPILDRRIEITAVRRNGDVFPVELAITPLKSGDSYHFTAFIADVTERKDAEDALRESETRFRAVVDTVPAAIWIYDGDRIIFANEAMCAMTGRSEEQLMGPEGFWERLSEEDRASFRARGDARLRGERAVGRFEFQLHLPGGATRWMDATATSLTLGGRPATLISAWDITDRKLAEDSIRESEARFRAVVDTVPAGIWISDGERMLFANEAASVMSGYSNEEILAPGFLQRLVHPEDLLAVTDRAARRLRGEPVDDHYDVRNIRKDGQVRWFHNFARPTTFDGRPASLIATIDLTDRRTTENAIRESEARFRAVVDTVPAAIWIYDGERMVFANEAATTNSGYSHEEILAPGFLRRLVHPDDFPLQEDRAARRLRGEPVESQYELRHVQKDGEVRWFHNFATPTTFDGRPASLVASIDITDRKHAEITIRESEARFRAVVDTVPAAIWIYDGDRIVFANESAATLTGYSHEEILAAGYLQRIVHPEDLPVVAERGARRLQGEPVEQHYETRIVRKDGQVRWANADVLPITFDGRPASLVASIDVTERRAVETTIRESEARFRAVVDTVTAAIWIYDGERMVFANEAASVMSGYSHEEILAPGYLERFTHPEDLPVVADRSARRLRGEPVEKQFETRVVRKDGQVRWADSTVVPITIDGRPASLVAHIDITDRKNAEEERRKLDLQMQHAQKLESLGVLAGGIAHDFNNLLVAVLGNAGLALMELPPESPARQTVQSIEIAAQRAADLTRQMLAYSGKGRFFVEPINLSRLVEEMGHLLEVSVSKRAILKYHFAPETPLIDADATQVRQVVMNLITNASDAIGDRSGVIAISTGMLFADRAYLSETYLDNDLPEGDYTFVEVSDTGSGMDEETRGRIFDPFFTTKFTGRGLGLAAVLGIVRGHRGAIKIYSEVGRGTTFKVLFPVSELAIAAAPAPTAEMPREPSISPGTILVVDDDETVRAVTRRMLEYSGYTVILAPDGREALDIFHQQGGLLDVVLLDMTMPHMDGEATFRELRRIDPAVRVVLMSGYNEADATEQFSGKGLAGFIQKPFRTPDLLARIRDALA